MSNALLKIRHIGILSMMVECFFGYNEQEFFGNSLLIFLARIKYRDYN